MKVLANTLRPGNVLDYNNSLYVVEDYEIVQPGKGAAVIQIVMRDIRTGNKDNVRFRTQETVERIRLDQSEFQYLYEGEHGHLVFMNTETYEQINVPQSVIGDKGIYLKDGMMVQLETYEGEPLGIELPSQITLEVEETEPVIKGQTASSSYKPAIMDNGLKVMVPPHINRGDRIVIKTEDGSYVERAKD